MVSSSLSSFGNFMQIIQRHGTSSWYLLSNAELKAILVLRGANFVNLEANVIINLVGGGQ